jgi:hypothetical protein
VWAQRLYREYLFEKIRSSEFPERPSRMEVAFAFEDVGFATSWKRGQLPELLYEVEPFDAGVATCALDMGWFDALNNEHSFPGAELIARRYWSGARGPSPQIELLVSCSLRVVRRITVIPDDLQRV